MVTLSRMLAYPLALLALTVVAGTGTARAQSSAEPTTRLVVFEDFTRFT
ncbi:MAG: hypothetical protein ABR961_01085 [Thermoanaerobaculaceae bacterium]|jgi:hypothetical protein